MVWPATEVGYVPEDPGMTLPNFLVIGAMRSGTTSLVYSLRVHPEVFIPREKELHYFTALPDPGRDWYEKFFETSRRGVRAIGEATPNYMYDPMALVRAKDVLPEARLIAILRNPVERAYSHYWWNRLRGREPLDFVAALRAEPARLEMSRQHRFVYSYMDKGRYFQQLTRVCTIYPREALLVLLLDDLKAAPHDCLKAVCRFLGIKEEGYRVPDRRRRTNAYYQPRSRVIQGLARKLSSQRWPLSHVGDAIGRLNRVERSYPPMPGEAREFLQATFEHEIEQLERWLGRDLSSWRAGEASTAWPVPEANTDI